MDKGMLFNAIVGSFVDCCWRKNATRTKTMRVMKLTALIVLTAFLQVAAKGVAQDKITFTGKDVPLEKVFTAIKKQTSYLFLYNDALLVNAKKVTLQVKNASLEEVLSECFKDQPFDYKINGRTIFIINRPEPEKKEQSVVNETTPGDEVKGRITNAQGEPLSGANIVVKRTGKGTQANANGEFTLKNVDANESVTISFTGYAPQTIKVGSRKSLMLVMQVADNELDEMVVQGYGTTTRRLATGNIAKVTAAEIEKQPVMNPLLALQGRVAGLEVRQVNGFASAPIKIEIRGRNNIDGNISGQPLYIIDGVPLTVLELNTTTYATGSTGFIQNGLFNGPAGGQSPFFSINPADIESIEVLKDGDATSIYGSRGANGVILVTTKKGKVGNTKFDINIQQGINKVTKYYDMLTTSQYLAMRREAFQNDGVTPTTGNAPDLLVFDTTRYTDWQKELWGGTGKNTNMQFAVSGGNTQTSFRIGGAYVKATNILTVSGADQRASVSFNLAHMTLNKKIRMSFTSQYSFTKSDMTSVPNVVTLPPNAPSIYDSNGKLNYFEWQPVASGIGFPFAGLIQPYTAKTNFLNGNLTIDYNVLKGLVFKVSLGFNNAQNNQLALFPISSRNPVTNPVGEASFGNNSNKNWVVEPQAEYNTFLGKGNLNVLIGGSNQSGNTQGGVIYGSEYTSDFLIRTVSNAPTVRGFDNYGQYKYAAAFGRINYNWRNKYIINLSVRRDGSSNFGSGNQFGKFYSAGVAWIFTEENWIKEHLNFLSFGKLRVSYGTTGGEGPAYGYLTKWVSSNQTYTNTVPLEPTQHANPNYRWQLNKKLETAIDLSFLNDKINLEVVYYKNRCGNQIIPFPVPVYTGFSGVTANSPALVQNDGLEFTVSSKIVNGKNFSWRLMLNGSFNRNKLISYPNFESSPFTNVMAIGKSINSVKLLRSAGVDPQTGLYIFEDQNNDGNISVESGPRDDRYYYNLSPKFLGGAGSNFSYKRLQLYLFFSIKKQIGINALSGLTAGLMKNMPLSILERWQKAGDFTDVARFTVSNAPSYGFFTQSDGIYTDASFVRLSNASLSYSLPEKAMHKAGMKGCNVFVNVQNLFVITSYNGIDPETQNFGGMPPAKIITGGLTFNF